MTTHMPSTRPSSPRRRAPRLACCALAAAAGAAMLPGCRGTREDSPPRQFFPDMDNQMKWRPQGDSRFFPDGRMMRQPVANSVPFGAGFFASGAPPHPLADDRDVYLKEDDSVYRGVDERGELLGRIPIPVTEELLARGQERFNIYCAACHGYLADGQGMVGRRWSIPIPNFHEDRYKDPDEPEGRGRDGFFFVTALEGVGPPEAKTMPPYRFALSERDAWAVVAYIRALQVSQEGTLADVPAPQRAVLEAGRAEAIARQAQQAPPPPPTPLPADAQPQNGAEQR